MPFLDRHHFRSSHVGFEAFHAEASLVWALMLSLLLSGCRNQSTDPGSRGAKDTATPTAFDLRDRSANPFDMAGTNSVVLIFVGTECPISNRYAPEIRRLEQKFGPFGIRFWLVYADPEVSADAIQAHLKAYDLPVRALRDPKHDLVRFSHVHVTPEAAVFVAGPRLVYHGRIDDRYVDFGKDRLEPTQHDLERVVDAIVHGRAVPEAATRAIGCYISGSE
jgi:hypothetical protein